MNTNAICGNCGETRLEHDGMNRSFPLGGDFDFFTDLPRPQVLIDFIRKRQPELVREVIEAWRKENGHE